jgi:hypothetical protein
LPETMPIACSLDQKERRARAELIAALGQDLQALEAELREAKLWFAAERRPELIEFVRDESRCCPFFAFSVVDEPGRVRLEVGAPEHGEWAVRGLVAGFVAGWAGLV